MSQTISQDLSTAGGLFHLGVEVDPEVDALFEHWCEARLADGVAFPGLSSARLLVKHPGHSGVGASPKHLVLCEAESESAARAAVQPEFETGLPGELAGRLQSRCAFYRAIGDHPGHDGTRRMGPAILHVTVDVDPEWRDAFLDWYVGVHVPAVLHAPGMLGARRFEHAALASGEPIPEGQHSYCTIYEMADADLIDRPETQAASARGLCPARIAPHRVAMNFVYAERVCVRSPEIEATHHPLA
jgi:hypothetical protein